MDLELTGEQAQIRDLARDFARRELAPKAAELDRTGRFPTESFRALGELGLLGVNVPAAYGGAEAGVLSLTMALNEVAYACASTAVGMSVTNMVAETIARFGSEGLAGRYVPRLTSGEAVAGAFCLSEPGAGTDAAGLQATARREGDHYVLNGTKMWITSGDHAGVFIVMARTGAPDSRHEGISAFVVEPSFEGLSTGKPEEKCGLKGSSTVPVILEDCVVPADNLLADEGMGFTIAMAALDGGRITIGAMANGIARAALDAASTYALERKQFGKPIGTFQAIQHKLADMAVGIEASELLVRRAAWLKERGERRFTREAAMAKVHATENAKRVTDEAIQIHGGYGYTREYPVERYMRDARVTTIFEGTTEIQKVVIAREIL
ncbi:MAG: acyl-CoA dehydrogenase family protein [Myxococcota bacterium]